MNEARRRAIELLEVELIPRLRRWLGSDHPLVGEARGVSEDLRRGGTVEPKTMVVDVRTSGGVVKRSLDVAVGRYVEIVMDETEHATLDGVDAVWGPARVKVENRGKDGVTLLVEKGDTK